MAEGMYRSSKSHAKAIFAAASPISSEVVAAAAAVFVASPGYVASPISGAAIAAGAIAGASG